MNCEQIRKKLNAYVDTELPGATSEKIAIHLQTCRDCSKVFSHLQNLTNVLQEVSTPEVPKGFANRVLAHANERNISVKSKQRTRASVFRLWNSEFLTAQRASVAAVLISGLALGALMGLDTWRSPTIQSGGQPQIAQAEAIEIYNLDYLTDIPKGSLADAYLALMSETNGRGR